MATSVPSLRELSTHTFVIAHNLEGYIENVNTNWEAINGTIVDLKMNHLFLENLCRTRKIETLQQTNQRIQTMIQTAPFVKDKQLLLKHPALRKVPNPIIKIVREHIIILDIEKHFYIEATIQPENITNLSAYSYRSRPIILRILHQRLQTSPSWNTTTKNFLYFICFHVNLWLTLLVELCFITLPPITLFP